MSATLRLASIIGCVIGLCALGTAAPSAGAAASQSNADGRPVSTSAGPRVPARPGPGLITLGRGGWQVQSTAPATRWTTGTGATQSGNRISAPGFSTAGWLAVAPDDAGAAGTEVEALLQSGACPDDRALEPVNASVSGTHSVFYSDNLTRCFGPPMTSPGADTDPLFAVPWWFRTTFSPRLAPGQDATIVINGVVGQADVWVNGTEVATQATVEGDYTRYTFDVTNLLRRGQNVLALEMYPNNPATMLTLDNVDWSQIPPDNNTGIQFPVQLHIAGALGISNTYVTQDDAPDMSAASLTVHGDVTNHSGAPQAGTVTATITPPGGGRGIQVTRRITLAPGASTTVTFTPAAYPQLTLVRPRLWWPYQMGGQPLYRLRASVSGRHGVSDAAPPADFGIRRISTYLTKPSALTPDGVRVFEINGVPFDYRAGGWSENLFLHYSAADLANQVTLIKSMGLNGIRTEGKEMPQDFYDQMDRAGILIDAGFQCCDSWQPDSAGQGVTSQAYHVMYESSLAIGQRLRDHPSVLNFSWSDNPPVNEQEAASLAGFSQSGFQEPVISSAEYNGSGILGPSGEKEGPYDWVPPGYWYDTTHASHNATDNDPTLTNVGGSWGFDSEQGSGDTVPTMDSIKRFLSPSDQGTLWRQPDAHQFHTNYESTDGAHSGYAFGTLDNLDTAVRHRYGSWSSLARYDLAAQVQNYEDTRAQFEAFIDHWNHGPSPSTGTVYWQLNKGWPTLLWVLYNDDYDEAGAYFGAKKANEDLHVLYAYDTGGVTIDNLTGTAQGGLSVESRVHAMDGSVLADQTVDGPLTLKSQQVASDVLVPRVPAVTAPPASAKTYFVELILRQHGHVVDRNVYWLSTQRDVIDWTTTEGSPQADNGAPLRQYADMTALNKLPAEPVRAAASTVSTAGKNGTDVTSVTITNPSSNRAAAFFVRADVRRGTPHGAAPGDNQVLPITWTDNDITLWPGESETLTATYQSALLHGSPPVVSVEGWNVPGRIFAAPRSAAAVTAERTAQSAPGLRHFGAANGTAQVSWPAAGPAVGSTAAPGGTAAAGDTRGTGTKAGVKWLVTALAHSPDAIPPGSFRQGDGADTYTLRVTNSGTTPTDGTTPVTLTDVVDPNVFLVSVGGSGWTCHTANDPTEVCAETGGPGGKPAVLRPGQSYPPVTLRVKVPLGAGFGTQDSASGPHATNGVTVTGGSPARPRAASVTTTPIVGVPVLTADNAVDGAFQQGGYGRYEITVINTGGAPTRGSAPTRGGANPVTATITGLPAGVTVRALYGSGWKCAVGAITSPRREPARTCYRDDVLAGENGEEPPITVVASVARTARAGGNETVKVSGGGSAGGPASVSAATVILPAARPVAGKPSAHPPVLTVESRHTGSFRQGDAAVAYRLTVSDAAGAGPVAGTVTVADTLPPGLTPVQMTGDGWTCELAAATLPPTSTRHAPPNTYEPQPACRRSGPLAAGSAYPPITLRVAVANNTQPSVSNTVSVTGGGAARPGRGADPTAVKQLPILAVTGFPAAGGIQYAPFTRGGAGADSYTIMVANDGYAATTAPVTVQAALPSGLTARSITAADGWTCQVATVTCTTKPGVRLAAGERDQITVRVAVRADAPPSVQVLLQAAGGGALPAAATDENNDYSVVSNGGVSTVPTYIAP